MRRHLVGTAAISILLSAIWAVPVFAANFVEIDIHRYEAEGAVLHSVFVGVAKDGATTCELTTPTDTYSCVDEGSEFRPELGFFTDHFALTFAELQAEISGGWTLTWDAGPSQTVMTIDLGNIAESDFLPVPMLSAPYDTEPIQIPGDPNPPTIEWTSGTDPSCDYAAVVIADAELWWNANISMDSDELACPTTSWTPTAPLDQGSWFVTVLNAYAARLVPVGLTVVEGTWVLENEDWLNLSSVDRSGVVPTEPMSWGGIKTRFQ